MANFFTSASITNVLPSLSQVVLAVVDRLRDIIGVESVDDLQHVTEADLLPVLQPIKARKLISAWAQSGRKQ